MIKIMSRVAVLVTALALGACVHAGGSTTRTLPNLPAYVSPVVVPSPKKGDDALVVAARERSGRSEANRRLISTGKWYECVRKSYADGVAKTC